MSVPQRRFRVVPGTNGWIQVLKQCLLDIDDWQLVYELIYSYVGDAINRSVSGSEVATTLLEYLYPVGKVSYTQASVDMLSAVCMEIIEQWTNDLSAAGITTYETTGFGFKGLLHDGSLVLQY